MASSWRSFRILAISFNASSFDRISSIFSLNRTENEGSDQRGDSIVFRWQLLHLTNSLRYRRGKYYLQLLKRKKWLFQVVLKMDKKELNEAYEQRSQMEKRMCEIINFLNLPGTSLTILWVLGPNGKPPVGLHGNLLDDEGYPRDDIDIVQVLVTGFIFYRFVPYDMN